MDVMNFAFFAKKKATAQAIAGLQSQVSAILSGSGLFEGYVERFADLPAAADHASRIWVVKQASGIILVNRKESGLYLSNGLEWTFLDSSNSELAKFTVGAESLTTENLTLEAGPGFSVVLDKPASKVIFSLPNVNQPNGALLLDSTGKVPDAYLQGYSMKPQGDIASPSDRLALGDGNLPVGTILKVANAVEGENGTSYLLMSSPSSNPDNWIVFTGANFPVTMVFGRSGAVVAELGDYTADLITLAQDVDVHIAGTDVESVLGDVFQKLGNKADKGLGNVLGSDLVAAIMGAGLAVENISGLQQALEGKQPMLTSPGADYYLRGDKAWMLLNKDAVGLSDVDNTSDASKPISDAVQTALNAKEGSVTAGTAAQYYRGDKTWQSFGAASLAAPLDGLTTADSPIANGISLIAALGRLQGQISGISTPNKFNVDLSSGASAANCYFDDSYYHLFGSGTLTAAGAAQFPRLPLVGSIAEANVHAAMVAGFFHRWLIAFGGENDYSFDQLANSQVVANGLFSGTTFLGGLSTGTTDVDDQALNTSANEFFIIPVARDASYIYYITAAYVISPNYTAAYGNKSVIFYSGTGGLGSPMAPVISSYAHSSTFSVRYATSLSATQGQSIWMQLIVKKRNG